LQQITDFILRITYPPSPVRNLDNSLTPTQQAGQDFFPAQHVPEGRHA